MRKLFCCIFIFTLFFSSKLFARENTGRNDSNRVHFHVALSLRPLISFVTPIDSDYVFFYSYVMYEPQVSFRNHWLAFGFNYSNKLSHYTLNGIPCEIAKTFYTLSPAYFYRFYNKKEFEIKAGPSFVRTVRFTEDRKYTSLETITETTTNIDNALGAAIRFTFKFKKFISIETELASYVVKSNYNFKQNYPLTPSLGRKSAYSYWQNHDAIPANIYLKFTF